MEIPKGRPVEERRSIGYIGSCLPAVLGMKHPSTGKHIGYLTPMEAYQQIRGELEKSEPSELMRLGLDLEPIAFAWLERNMGSLILRDILPTYMATANFYHSDGWVQREDYPWWAGHVDGLISVDVPTLPIEKGILEIKTTAFLSDDDGWGPSGSDLVPVHVVMQCHHYMIAAKASFAVVVALGRAYADWRVYFVKRDQRIVDILEDALPKAWNRIVAGEMPDPVDPSDFRFLEREPSKKVEADQHLIAEIFRLKSARADSANSGSEEKEAKVQIAKMLGDAEVVVDGNGSVLLTCKKNVRGATTFLVK